MVLPHAGILSNLSLQPLNCTSTVLPFYSFAPRVPSGADRMVLHTTAALPCPLRRRRLERFPVPHLSSLGSEFQGMGVRGADCVDYRWPCLRLASECCSLSPCFYILPLRSEYDFYLRMGKLELRGLEPCTARNPLTKQRGSPSPFRKPVAFEMSSCGLEQCAVPFMIRYHWVSHL